MLPTAAVSCGVAERANHRVSSPKQTNRPTGCFLLASFDLNAKINKPTPGNERGNRADRFVFHEPTVFRIRRRKMRHRRSQSKRTAVEELGPIQLGAVNELSYLISRICAEPFGASFKNSPTGNVSYPISLFNDPFWRDFRCDSRRAVCWLASGGKIIHRDCSKYVQCTWISWILDPIPDSFNADLGRHSVRGQAAMKCPQNSVIVVEY